MKKLLFGLIFFTASTFTFAGERYKIDEAAIDQLFAQSEDISAEFTQHILLVSNLNQSVLDVNALSEQTQGGFLLRTFFCGWIGLHRGYMGSDMSDLWWKYCGLTLIGGIGIIVPGIDFVWVLFVGEPALSKYKGTDKFLVWL